MKKILLLFCIILAGKGIAQTSLVNSGGTKINIGTGVDVKVHHVTNTGTGSAITSNGDLYLKGNFNQTTGATYTGGASSWLWFEGTTAQTVSSDATIAVARLKIDNATGVQLAQNLSIANNLEVVNGDLDLNGKNIDLGSTGILAEDRANNHLVTDNTAASDFVQGGGITFNATVSNASGEIQGTGLTLTHTGTAGNDYAVAITRKHYKGAVNSRGGHGIERIYAITGTPTVATTMRIDYATDETTGAGSATDFVLYRWQSATGWLKGGDAGAGFAHGMNNVGSRFVTATGITAFSHWTVGSSATPLPISLLYLKGERIEQAGEKTEEVKLTWATASEVSNKGFEIQVSDNTQIFKTIAFKEGAGNSISVNSYHVTFNNASDAYYRLKQLDFDGTFSYSPIVFVEGIEILAVYPNPNNGTFKVVCGTQTTADKLDLPARLLNAQGTEVWKGDLPNAQTEVKTNLPAGVYFLHTTVAGKVKVTKVIIEQ